MRCDLLLNEGGGSTFEYRGVRRYGVCCGEKGIFRFRLTARGVAGHASLPRTGDNALLKLAPVLERLAGGQPGYDLTDPPRALLEALGFDAEDPAAAVAAVEAADPALRILLEPLLGVTLTPTVIHASDKINVIPSRADLKVDCRVPPGFGDELALARLREVLGDAADGIEIEFTEKVFGYESPIRVAADGRDRPLGRRQRPGGHDRAGAAGRLLGLELVPPGVPGPGRVRLLSASPPDAARDGAAGAQRQRADRRP